MMWLIHTECPQCGEGAELGRPAEVLSLTWVVPAPELGPGWEPFAQLRLKCAGCEHCWWTYATTDELEMTVTLIEPDEEEL